MKKAISWSPCTSTTSDHRTAQPSFGLIRKQVSQSWSQNNCDVDLAT
jgi:hypothetical protein